MIKKYSVLPTLALKRGWVLTFVAMLFFSLTAASSAQTTVKSEQKNDISPGTIQFESANYTVNEGSGFVTITATRTGGSSGGVAALVIVSDVTATSPADYLPLDVGIVDASFALFSTRDMGEVTALAVQPDDKILAAEWLNNGTQGAHTRIVRLNPDGSRDSTFTSSVTANGIVTKILLQPDGKILFNGYAYNGSNTNTTYIRRLNSDGSLDNTFSVSSGNSPIDAIALQPDGKIFIGGSGFGFNGVERRGVARLNPDGSLDPSFNITDIGNISDVNDIAIQPDGKIIIVGEFYTGQFPFSYGAARLHSDGLLDNTFVTPLNGPSAYVNKAIIQPDGKVVVGGVFDGSNGVGRRDGIVRLNGDGSIDNIFGGNAYNVRDILPQPNGKFIVLARTYAASRATRYEIARANSNGSADPTFLGSNFSYYPVGIIDVDAQSDGKLIIAGQFINYNGAPNNRYVARLSNVPLVSWADGESGTKTITVAIVDNNIFEPTETFKLELANPTGGASLGASVTTTITIFDNDVPTGVTLESNPSPSELGQNVTFSATVRENAPGAGSPGSGVVTFTQNATVLGAVEVNSEGVATLNIQNLQLGENIISARYGGNNIYTASLSVSITHTVIPACDRFIVTTGSLDNGSCGTLRAALLAASTSPTKTINISLTAGSVISLTSGITLTEGVVLRTNQPAIDCSTDNPPIIIQGVGANSGDGVTLLGDNSLYGVWIRDFSGRQLVVLGGNSKLECVRITKT